MSIPISPPHKLYRNILLAFTISITTTIFILSTILYISFERVGLKTIHSFVKDGLTQISYSATYMNDLAKSLSLQIYFNDNITKLSYLSLPDIREEYLATEQLTSYRNTAPSIHSIYVYNAKRDTFYTSMVNMEKIEPDRQKSFFDQEIVGMMHNLGKYKRLTPIPRKIPNPYPELSKNAYTNVYTFLFYDSPEESAQQDDHIIVLNISEDWLRKMMEQLDIEPQSNTFIIDSKGTLVIRDNSHDILTSLSGQPYIERILTASDKSGYFIDDVNGAKSLITYFSSDLLDWKFIRITPYNSIVDKITEMKTRTFVFGLLILVSGLLASVFLSRKLYRPIRSMTSRLTSFQAEKTTKQKTIFLRHLLRNESVFSENELLTKFAALRISFDPTQPYSLILLTMNQDPKESRVHSASDKHLKKFAVMNIADEIVSATYACEMVDMDEDHIIVLCNVGTLAEDAQRLDEMFRNIQNHVHNYYHLSISAAVSTASTSFAEVGYLYDEVRDASNYRLIHGLDSIIFAENLKKLAEKQFAYPAEKEKLLLDALMLGNTAEAKEIYVQIVQYSLDYSYNILKSALIRLAVDLNMVVDTLQRNSGAPLPYNLNAFISELDRLQTLEDINRHFFTLFEGIVPKIKHSTLTKHDEVMSKIIETIHAQYADPNLSIERLAELVDMSAMYLGRLFKKMNTKSVAEYINQVRLGKAKELLLGTRLSILEISEQVGFLNSGYFYTLFKKATGITPNQYRKNRQLNDEMHGQAQDAQTSFGPD